MAKPGQFHAKCNYQKNDMIFLKYFNATSGGSAFWHTEPDNSVNINCEVGDLKWNYLSNYTHENPEPWREGNFGMLLLQPIIVN